MLSYQIKLGITSPEISSKRKYIMRIPLINLRVVLSWAFQDKKYRSECQIPMQGSVLTLADTFESLQAFQAFYCPPCRGVRSKLQ